MWLPTIISAEDLIEELSGLKTLEEIDLICHLYESYRICYGHEAENFDSFAKWGQLILQDFNEIDRYLADSGQLYENLKDIKEIENWSLGAETLSEYQTNYLKFMNSLGAIYKHFSSFLISKSWAYQGLAYKHAVLNQSKSNYANQFHKLIFCGFNALNAAELKIINRFYEQKQADILWDADRFYLDNPNQEAGLFLRNNFDFFKQREPSFIAENFKGDKDIKIISVPKQIGQAQVVKQSIQALIDLQVPLDRVAVVLANEKLLWPVLQQLPAEVEHVNITMEYPLKYTSTYGLIDVLLQLQLNFAKQNRKYKTVYHKDLVGLLRQPLFQNFLKAKEIDISVNQIIQQIISRNLTFITQSNLTQIFENNYNVIKNLLQPLTSINQFCETIQEVLQSSIAYFSKSQSTNQSNLELEYLQIIHKNFNRLNDILNKYTHFNDIQSFKQLYNQIVGNSSAPFIGEPLKGLQIMGVLETRTLDFDHIILVNVNEGVLPSGKTINSFIPNDLKRAFGLPLYLEKDAIYAYHFYRLLQKAKDITIIYDSETDSFGKGEKSRFVTQLQLEMKQYNPNINLTESVASYPNFNEETPNKIVIHKNDEVLKSVIDKAISKDKFGGLSPSGLIAFKECSLRFYYRYAAHLKETGEVEESAEANTFGSILHLSLEKLYADLIGKVIQLDALIQKLNDVSAVVNACFISFFDGNEPVGKSVLQQEVIKVYVKKLINSDIKFVENLARENHFLSLRDLEKEFSAPLEINLNGISTTVFIKGTVDRIDIHQGITRVIDYKSSVKDSDKFIFEGFEKLFHDKDYNKQLQLLIYAWLLHKNKVCEMENLQVCIVPFKVFLEEPKYILESKNKSLMLNDEFLNEFEQELKGFIETIFNTCSHFSQTEDKDLCEYCAYNTICNIT